MSDLNTLTTKPSLAKIAIIGRPNVGKSTLFNRLVGWRKAITDSTPGVTRDPVQGECEIEGRKVLLMDTGGLRLEPDELEKLVMHKNKRIIEEAALVLLMLDIHGLTPEDQEFIQYLRPFSSKIILLVNKLDDVKHEQDLWNYHSLGFSRVIGISAAHGRNMDELREGIIQFLPADLPVAREEREAEHVIKLAILGKPNTGKSTLANLLTASESSIVSAIPGTTRDVIQGRFLYKTTTFMVLDTAGIRRKKKVHENVEYYSVNRAIGTISESDLIFLLIDVEEGLTDQDKKIARLIVEKGKGIILVLNKWDNELERIPNMLQAKKDRIRFLFPVLDFAPLLAISALENRGIKPLLEEAIKVYRQLQSRVDTPRLNKALREWTEWTPPPAVKQFHYKVKYLTQTGVAPLEFTLFVNRKRQFPGSYLGFIENNLRKVFGLSSVPLRLRIKE